MEPDSLYRKTAPLSLAPHQVHIWSLDCSANGFDLSALRASLTADECERADRFVFDKDSQQFTYARGVLRWLLGRYLNCPAAGLHFDYGEHQKPFLPAAQQASPYPLYFNLSHSRQWVIYAFSHSPHIGIDIEYMHKDRKTLDIAERYFTPGEIERIKQAQDSQAAFYHYWTHKEAFIKATGKGLAQSLKSFEIEPDSGTRSRLRVHTIPEIMEQNWQLHALDIASDYQAALAIEQTDVVLTHTQLA